MNVIEIVACAATCHGMAGYGQTRTRLFSGSVTDGFSEWFAAKIDIQIHRRLRTAQEQVAVGSNDFSNLSKNLCFRLR
jgi:hypothetical protein